MSKKNRKKQSPTQDARSAKKAAVLGTAGKNNTVKILTFAAIILVIGGLFLVKNLKGGNGATIATSTAVASADGTVAYPTDMFADGKARYFEYANGDRTIRYFILKSSDGIIRAAFDACDVCWPAGKGYYQEGDVMVCRNCGRRFASVLVNEVQGGCNPAPLKRDLNGSNLVISVKDILEGGQYFDFARKG
jgi:uncharacterized membrane protein